MRIALFLIIAIGLAACNSKKSFKLNTGLKIKPCRPCEKLTAYSLVCGKDSFEISYGVDTMALPKSGKDFFSQSFHNYYYLKFFDSIHISNRLQKLYRDSITIERFNFVKEGSVPGCKTCNAEAVIHFRSVSKPMYMHYSDQQIRDFNNTKSYKKIRGSFVLSYYESNNESGILIRDLYRLKEPNILLKIEGNNIKKLEKILCKIGY